jgi:CysZ protein
MLLGMLPAVLVLVVMLAALVVLLLAVDDLVSWSTPFADQWGDATRVPLRIGVGAVVVAATLVLFVVSFTGLTLAVGEPCYDRIWRATEEMLGGPPVGDGMGFWRSARDGLVLLGMGSATAIGVLALGFVPVVGALLAAVVGYGVSSRLLGRELMARPLEARGLDRAARRELLRPHGSTVLGFGLATQTVFLLPLGAVVAFPAAVAGATVLARAVLDAQPATDVRD